METEPTAMPARYRELDTDLGNALREVGKPASETAPALPVETWSSAPTRQPVSSEDYNLEAFVAEEKSLADHLSDQLGLAVADPAMRLIGQSLINEIDEAGYLRTDLAGIAERLGAPVDLVEDAGHRPDAGACRHRRSRLAECLPSSFRTRPFRSGWRRRSSRTSTSWRDATARRSGACGRRGRPRRHDRRIARAQPEAG
jgi:RNA polymerase sigma-54 factor